MFAPGTFLGPYEVEALLGAGGMGEVYRARDSRLGRTVAIKVLPESVSRDPARRNRFDLEARAVASLSHPNICALFDIGDQGGIHYLVMEHLQGTTLALHLESGPLPVREALRVGSQVASGLAAAHAQGVIHRDLKPANIMLTPNGAKLLDFGLAKSLAPEAPAGNLLESPTIMETAAHVVLGTAAYMSPEQARGKPLDARTDVWSMGVVLYEMLTGQRFLGGDTVADVISAVLHAPPDWSVLPGDIPQPVRSLLEQLLERDLEKRPAQLTEAVSQLEVALADTSRVTVPSVEPEFSEGNSIVVVPFANLSPDPENEYFSDGLTEEVIADLSQVRALQVISRTTAMGLKGTKQDLRTLAKELKVRYALEGSVRKAGNDLRIITQLIDTRSDQTLWSDKYRGTLDDVFEIQEEVSRAIVKSLRVTLTPDEDKKLAQSPGPDPRAYDVYLKTRRDIEGFTQEGLDRARKELEEALGLLGEQVLLYKGLGMAYWQYVNSGLSADRGYLDQAETCARKILEMEPESPHGTMLMGLVAIQRGDIRGWLRNFEKAYAADPGDPQHGIWLGLGWAWTGFPERARPVLERQLAVDPHSSYIHFGLGMLAFYEKRYEAAFENYERAARFMPEHPAWSMVKTQVLASQGNGEALRRLMESIPAPESHHLVRLCHILCHAWLGDNEAVERLDREEYREAIWGDFQYTYIQAQAYALLNRKDDALRWLEQSCQLGNIHYPYLSKRDPILESLRSDPRFDRIMQRVRVRQEGFEAEVFG
jgi:serine/threonine protein kinase